jgi:hypothetical protein
MRPFVPDLLVLLIEALKLGSTRDIAGRAFHSSTSHLNLSHFGH